MAYEEWVKRPDLASQTIWDDGFTDWDLGVDLEAHAISPITVWDETPGGEVWIPRRPYIPS